jgi:hypothetical protein
MISIISSWNASNLDFAWPLFVFVAQLIVGCVMALAKSGPPICRSFAIGFRVFLPSKYLVAESIGTQMVFNLRSIFIDICVYALEFSVTVGVDHLPEGDGGLGYGHRKNGGKSIPCRISRCRVIFRDLLLLFFVSKYFNFLFALRFFGSFYISVWKLGICQCHGEMGRASCACLECLVAQSSLIIPNFN